MSQIGSNFIFSSWALNMFKNSVPWEKLNHRKIRKDWRKCYTWEWDAGNTREVWKGVLDRRAYLYHISVSLSPPGCIPQLSTLPHWEGVFHLNTFSPPSAKLTHIHHFRINRSLAGWAHSQRRVGINITIPPPLTVMWMNFDSPNFPSFCSLSAIILFQTCS